MTHRLTGVKKQFLRNNLSIYKSFEMKKLILPLLILIVIAQSCVTSLQPLVTYNTAVTEDRIAGNWNSDGQDYTVQKFFDSDLYKKLKKEADKNKSDENKKLSEKEMSDSILYSKSYIVKYTKNKIEYHLFGTMIKLNGRYFIDFTAADLNTIDNNGDAFEITFTDRLNTHSIARVQFNNSSTLKLDFIDGGFLYDQVQSGRMKIKNERDELYETFLITASTNELQQFIQKYGNDDRFFNKKNSVTLIRKS